MDDSSNYQDTNTRSSLAVDADDVAKHPSREQGSATAANVPIELVGDPISDTPSASSLPNPSTSVDDTPESPSSSSARNDPLAGISKKQRKRLMKRELLQEKKRQKKEERHAKAIAAGRDLVAEQKLQEDRAALGLRRKRLEDLWQTVKRPLAQKSFQICIDCSFEDVMMDREIASLAQQLRYCYSYNKNAPNPCLVSATSLKDGDTTLQLIQKEAGFSEWSKRLFTCTEQGLEEWYGQDQKDKIVYLTSDSETTLSTLEDSKIYVIGGIVDRNRLKRVAIDRANQLGVATAKLPLDDHLSKMASTPVLTCNHVFDILLKCRHYQNDWSKALQDVLPSRKEATFKTNPSIKERKTPTGDERKEDHTE